MKAFEVISAGACSNQAKFQSLEAKKSKGSYNGIVIRNIMKGGIDFTVQDVYDAIDAHMNPEVFHSVREHGINTESLVSRMTRFQSWLEKQRVASTIYIPAGEETVQGIDIPFDLIVKDGCDVRVFKIKNKKNDELTWRGKKNRVDESMELFLLQLVGEKLYPGASCSGCIAFLRDKQDSASKFTPVDEYAGVIQHHFINDDRWAAEDKLEAILNGTHPKKCGDCSSCPYETLCKEDVKETALMAIPPQPKASGNVSFTRSQQKMINANNGVFRVLAGAGSGKTTCIANRICKLIEQSHPKKILLITYTTKGVEEMREKIEYWMAENGQTQYNIDDFNIFTFNSFGYEIIKQHYEEFGFTEEPRLIEKQEEMQLIQELLDMNPEIPGYDYANPLMNFHQFWMPVEMGRGVCIVMSEYFKILKSQCCMTADDVAYVLKLNNPIAVQVFNLFEQYQDILSQRNLVDYEDQIALCYQFYADNENLRKYGFEHIIVDEFQDSNQDQINLLYRMNQYPYIVSLMVVGDDSQAIFEFRGANSDGIINFHKYFDAVDINLMENFRSTKEICQVANYINDVNLNKVPKTLISSRSGQKVELFGSASEWTFMDKVIEAIKTQNLSYSDVAIISRNRRELVEFKHYLDCEGIPSIIAASELLIDHPHTKIIVDFFRFLVDTNQSLYYAEFLKLQDPVEFENNIHDFQNWFQKKKKAFLDDYFCLHTETDKVDFIFTILDDIAIDSRAVTSLMNILRGKNLRSIIGLNNFLDSMMLYQADYQIEKIDVPVNAVTITTAHSSKGKEWKHCFIYLNKFRYPKSCDYQAQKNLSDFEAERRLLFVAVTRAKETLTMGGAMRSSIYTEIEEAFN